MKSIHCYSLPYSIRSKLEAAGFCYDSDLKNISNEKLSKETSLTLDEVNLVTSLVLNQSSALQSVLTGDQLLQIEQSNEGIITFSQKLDEILGGGIPLCKITEICGCSGTGKTQLCLQLSVDVQIPKSMGGLDGQTIFIDTEHSFFTERVMEIASAAIEHCHMVYASQIQELGDFTMDKILNGIHYLYCQNYIQLIAFVNQLPKLLDKYNKVKLIIIDSIAFHFRYGYDDTFYKRTKTLNNLSQLLIKVATERKIAVVWTNQMTTKFGEKKTVLIPSLGENFAHNCNLKVLLFWDKELRKAMLLKSACYPECTASFQILISGVRDIQLVSDKSYESIGKRQKV